MIYAKVLAMGPGKSFSVYVGQGDFENHSIDLNCLHSIHEIYSSL
jgi:hypothetical protein